MTTLLAVKKLLLGETWWLPGGIALTVSVAELVVRPLIGGDWDRLGGFVLLVGVLLVLVTSVARAARPGRDGPVRTSPQVLDDHVERGFDE